MSIADLRREYKARALSETDVCPSPVDQFRLWLDEATRSDLLDATAMTLATASADGTPSARIVLLKGVGDDGFVFFTNYESAKAADLEANPRACLVCFWAELERQVRVTGHVSRTSPDESDAYFLSRPRDSQLGAWASPQSHVITSRNELDQRLATATTRFADAPLVRPAHWGGYRVQPQTIEFWQGRPNRLHDRIRYRRDEGAWRIERLAP